eukprot:5275636-Amphidinium_carterae.1
MCARFLASVSTKGRPNAALAVEGSGLSHFTSCVGRDLDCSYSRRPQMQSVGLQTMTITQDNVSLPAQAAVVQLTSKVLPQFMVEVLSAPDGLVKPVHQMPASLPAMFVDVENWAGIALRLLQLQMVKLVYDEDVVSQNGEELRAGIFGVPKANGPLCRMIVDRRRRNAIEDDIRSKLLESFAEDRLDEEEFTRIWRRMCLPHPSCLMDMIWGPSTRVICSMEDCADFFYLLRMPKQRELDAILGHSLAGHQLGREVVESADLLFHPDRLYSLSLLTVAMGDIKAMEIAQAVHQTVLLEHACLPPTGWITLGWSLGDGPHIWGAYCDDFAQFSLLEPASSIAEFAVDVVTDQARAQLKSVHHAYRECELVRKEAKAEFEIQTPTFWGATMDSSRGVLHGHVDKLRTLVLCTCRVLRRRFVTCAMIEKLIGYWTHHALFLRLALSVFQDVYTWITRSSHHRHRLRPLPPSVRDELLGMIALWPDLECSLRTAPCPVLFASDASQHLAGVVRSTLSLHEAVLTWSFRPTGVQKGRAILSDAGLYQLSRDEVKNEVFEDLMRAKTFDLVATYRFSKQESHINLKELLAARTALRAAARDPLCQGTRVTLAIDSQVVVWVLRKGRSSSKKLNRVLQSCLCSSLAGRLRLQPLWVSTENNPADDPSRRAALRAAVEPSACLRRALQSVPEQWAWASEMTRLLWAQQLQFDSSKGYPGEGPSLRKLDPAGGRLCVPRPRDCADLRLSVAQCSLQRLKELPTLQSLCQDLDSLALVLTAFVQWLHNEGQPYTHAVETLAGVQFFQTQRMLQSAWRAVRTWGQTKPIQDPPLIALLGAIFSGDAERTLLSPGGTMGLQRKFLLLKDMIGIGSSPWTLASIRGGGCVHFVLHSQDMDYLQWKGRWASQKSMRHYMQLGLGVASYSTLPPQEKQTVMTLAQLASPLLHHRTNVTLETPKRSGRSSTGIPGEYNAEIGSAENHVPVCLTATKGARTHHGSEVTAVEHIFMLIILLLRLMDPAKLLRLRR